jgi:hypothetical protein
VSDGGCGAVCCFAISVSAAATSGNSKLSLKLNFSMTVIGTRVDVTEVDDVVVVVVEVIDDAVVVVDVDDAEHCVAVVAEFCSVLVDFLMFS